VRVIRGVDGTPAMARPVACVVRHGVPSRRRVVTVVLGDGLPYVARDMSLPMLALASRHGEPLPVSGGSWSN
jgi:hypothetical protein